jgi:hypothetical protein
MAMRGGEQRTERQEIRLTYAEKQAVERIAKASRRTVSSLFQEWVDILIKDEKANAGK